MFRKKFSEEMLNIKPSEQSKANLLEKIETEQEKSTFSVVKKRTKIKWASVIAAMLAIVVFSVSTFVGNGFFSEIISTEETVLNDKGVKVPVISHQEGIPASVTHNQVYELFNAIALTQAVGQYTGRGDDFVVLEDDTDSALDVNAGLKGNENTAMPEGEMGITEESSDDYEDVATEDYSTTNLQVADVDEADIVKTNGKYIYILKTEELIVNVAKAEKGKLTKIASINILKNVTAIDRFYNVTEMYLYNDRIVAIYEVNQEEKVYTKATIINVANPQEISFVCEYSQSGSYLSSRMINGKFYLFTTDYFYRAPTKDDKTTYLPCTTVNNGEPTPVNEGSIYMFDGEVNRSYLTVSALNAVDGKVIDTKTALGGGATLYANTKGFYVTADASSISYLAGTATANYINKTRIIRFEINEGKISAMAEGYVEGAPLNQFSMDEHNNHFRIVTTSNEKYTTTNSVYVLNKELKTVGKITDIAKGERVYSVRFMGDTGYFVTFRQVDPLFAVDLKDPKNPKILSALKIPGFSNYMHPWGEGLLLGIGAEADENSGDVTGIKLSMFDISNPEKVSEKAKTVLSIAVSDVGVEHKSILANVNKNLIGFAANDGKYFVYGYSSENGFTQKAELEIPMNKMARIYYPYYYYMQNTRGMYIGDYFYLCGPDGINSYELSDFKAVDSLIF